MTLLANHLWQSTLVAAVLAALTVVLRRNRAGVRHWIWFAASVKFLVPFALLIALGNQFAWRPSPDANAPVSAVAVVIESIGQPFSPSVSTPLPSVPSSPGSSRVFPALRLLFLVLWGTGAIITASLWWVRWRRIAALIENGHLAAEGRELDILRRLEAGEATAGRQPLPLVMSDGSLEPGVFGIRHPVLLWPRSISARLTDEQIEAILAHELAHVSRRDNLSAAIHMAAQSLFWFHPMVWWIGARLVDEREQACDDEVIRLGNAPHVYAEGILKTCEFYVESPLACVAGVTGSDLKKRITQIMRSEAALDLAGWRRSLLVIVAIGIVGGPIAAGALAAPSVGAPLSRTAAGQPRFSVALIKRNESGRNEMRAGGSVPGQFVYANVTLRSIISNAYGMALQPLSRDQLLGAPGWVDAVRFDVVVKADGHLQQLIDAGPGRSDEGPLPSMFRALLAERFNLVVHNERRDLPIYTLTKIGDGASLGPQIRTSISDCRPSTRDAQPPPPPPPAPLPGDRPRCGIRLLPGNISAGGVTMPQLANALSRLAGRAIVDQTELPGWFDLDLQWTPGSPAATGTRANLLAALEQQLGLRLTPENGPVDVVVVDHVEELNRQDDFDTPAMAPPPPLPSPPPPPLPPSPAR